MLLLYLKALMFGVAVAAPIGPMNILCMRRTLSKGWRFGVVTAGGIASSDAIYSAIAALGLTGISNFILAHEYAFHLTAGIFMGCFGLRIWLGKNESVKLHETDGISLPSAFGSSILMTLTNPLTLIFFVTAFTMLTPRGGFDGPGMLLTVAGVFTGSLSWMLTVVGGAMFFRSVINEQKHKLIDRVTGTFLIGLGITEIARAFG